MLLSPRLSGGMPAESSLAGDNSDSGIQLRPDGDNASSSARGGRRRHGGGGLCTALDSTYLFQFGLFLSLYSTSLTFGLLNIFFICNLLTRIHIRPFSYLAH
jgi:hypothetical protein